MPTYAYEFNDPNAPQRFLPPLSFPTGAYHASEIQYVFDLAVAGAVAGLHAGPAGPCGHDGRVLDGLREGRRSERRRRAGLDGLRHQRPTRFQSLAPAAVAPTTAFAADHKCSFWAPLLP